MAAGASSHNTAVDCTTEAHINSTLFLIRFYIAKDPIFASSVTDSRCVCAALPFSAVLMASVGMSLGVTTWFSCLLVLCFELCIDEISCVCAWQVQ
jgi:hypothetical protein